MKKLTFVLALGLAGAAVAGVPTVSDVTVVKASNRVLKMSYTLSGGPGIVMLSVTTNGVSVGEANLAAVSGDVNTIVENGTHAFTWNLKDTPLGAMKDGVRGASVSLVCRPLDNPPDYLVVKLSEDAASPRYTFAESADGLAGGLTNSSAYWTDLLVLRRIHARNVPWTMGSPTFANGYNASSSGAAHEVTLTNDYWAAVFQFTRGQWAATTTRPCPGQYKFSDRRPVDSVTIEATDTATQSKRPALRGDQSAAYRYPAAPHPDSLLGLLRARTGLAFDLPGEAMWEFAARAGQPEEQWGDGTPATAANLPGRFKDNGGTWADGTWPEAATTGVTNATAEVGSYAPSAFGLYDMHGNANEHCLDWYEADVSALNGAINANGDVTLSGATGEKTVSKGGCLGNDFGNCLPSRRYSVTVGGGGRAEGFRVFIHSLDPRL